MKYTDFRSGCRELLGLFPFISMFLDTKSLLMSEINCPVCKLTKNPNVRSRWI